MKIRCDFCGLVFDPACSTQSCSGCPLAKGCSHYICPRCGYAVLPESRLVGWLSKTFKHSQGSQLNTNKPPAKEQR
jgi:rubredoxin